MELEIFLIHKEFAMVALTCKGDPIYPKAIFCIGRNYVEHINELQNSKPDECVFFIKPPHALGESLHVSLHNEPIHYEGELVFVLGDGGFKAVGFGLDLTKRELQTKLKSKSLPWERSKAFRVSALVSEFVPFSSLESLRLELNINGKLVQSGGVKDMIYPPKVALKSLLEWSDVYENDLLFTGTPKGVGVVHIKDIFHCKVYENDRLLVEHEWIAT